MLTNWTPEAGFKDEEENKPALYTPFIVELKDLDKVSVDWENLRGDLRERCEKEGKWFPSRLTRNNILFPLPVWNKDNKEHVEFEEKFFNPEAIIWAKMFMLQNTMVPFYIPTPTLYCALHKNALPSKTLSTEVAIAYLITIFNLSPNTPDGLAILNSKEMIEVIHEIGDRENNPLATALHRNLFESGMMQHYFKEDRHEKAPETLCLILVQYGLRSLQVIERQFLRFGPLTYKKDQTDILCMSTRIVTSAPQTSEWTKTTTENCLRLYDLQVDEDPYQKTGESTRRIATPADAGGDRALLDLPLRHQFEVRRIRPVAPECKGAISGSGAETRERN